MGGCRLFEVVVYVLDEDDDGSKIELLFSYGKLYGWLVGCWFIWFD